MSAQKPIKAQDQYIDDLTGALKKDLERLFEQIKIKVAGQMQREIDFGAGPTPTNRRELRKIANSIGKMAKSMGADQVLAEFAGGFEGTLPYFDQILDTISATLKTPLMRKRSETDLQVLEGVKEASRQSVEASLEVMVAQAKRSMLSRVAALDFEETVSSISQVFGKGIAEAETLAATGLTMYARTNAEQNFKAIEKEFPGLDLRYRYEGPDDKLTRRFCDRLLAKSKKEGLTRAQIDKLSNGQLPNVFISGGGFNCRHQFILVPPKAPSKPAAKKAVTPPPPAPAPVPVVPTRTVRDSRPGPQVRRELANVTLPAEARKVLYADVPAKIRAEYSTRSATPVESAEIRAGVFAFERLIGAGLIDGKKVKVRFRREARGVFDSDLKLIVVSQRQIIPTMIHELGHFLELSSASVFAKAKAFLERRTTVNGVREPVRKLRDLTGNQGYGHWEVTRKDNFDSPYTGKVYEDRNGNVNATEIISMGLEKMYEDPKGFARSDPDYFDFIWSIMRDR